jgi:2-amino-4-hydroxy-6-hydroxymethyldihydropteridine diphosphokinase
MPREPVTAFVALGANLGDARQAVLDALQALAGLADTQVTGCSRLYRTAPHEASGPDFINAVARLSTRLTAPDLLQALQALELQAGRERPYVNAPRTLDLDVLLYGDARIDSPRLTVPHPRMWGRAFVIYPLAEVAPGLVTVDHLAAVVSQALAPV